MEEITKQNENQTTSTADETSDIVCNSDNVEAQNYDLVSTQSIDVETNEANVRGELITAPTVEIVIKEELPLAPIEAQDSVSDTPNKSKSSKLKQAFASFFTPLRIAYMALFTALSYIMYLPVFEFSLIPAVPFLKVDFSNAFVLIGGFALGPVAGVIIGVLKEILHALTFSQTIGVGEIANILMMLPFVLIPSIFYKKHKGIKTVLVLLAVGSVATTLISVPINYVLTFPFYLKLFTDSSWADGMNYFLSVWYWALLFNLVKTVLLSVAVFLIYKPLSKLIKLTNKKFSKKQK